MGHRNPTPPSLGRTPARSRASHHGRPQPPARRDAAACSTCCSLYVTFKRYLLRRQRSPSPRVFKSFQRRLSIPIPSRGAEKPGEAALDTRVKRGQTSSAPPATERPSAPACAGCPRHVTHFPPLSRAGAWPRTLRECPSLSPTGGGGNGLFFVSCRRQPNPANTLCPGGRPFPPGPAWEERRAGAGRSGPAGEPCQRGREGGRD